MDPRKSIKATNDPAFAEAIEHFAFDEQPHGAAPGQFADRYGARIRWNWGDGARRAFQWIVRLMYADARYAERRSRRGTTPAAPPIRRRQADTTAEPPSRTRGWLS